MICLLLLGLAVPLSTAAPLNETLPICLSSAVLNEQGQCACPGDQIGDGHLCCADRDSDQCIVKGDPFLESIYGVKTYIDYPCTHYLSQTVSYIPGHTCDISVLAAGTFVNVDFLFNNRIALDISVDGRQSEVIKIFQTNFLTTDGRDVDVREERGPFVLNIGQVEFVVSYEETDKLWSVSGCGVELKYRPNQSLRPKQRQTPGICVMTRGNVTRGQVTDGNICNVDNTYIPNPYGSVEGRLVAEIIDLHGQLPERLIIDTPKDWPVCREVTTHFSRCAIQDKPKVMEKCAFILTNYIRRLCLSYKQADVLATFGDCVAAYCSRDQEACDRIKSGAGHNCILSATRCDRWISREYLPPPKEEVPPAPPSREEEPETPLSPVPPVSEGPVEVPVTETPSPPQATESPAPPPRKPELPATTPKPNPPTITEKPEPAPSTEKPEEVSPPEPSIPQPETVKPAPEPEATPKPPKVPEPSRPRSPKSKTKKKSHKTKKSPKSLSAKSKSKKSPKTHSRKSKKSVKSKSGSPKTRRKSLKTHKSPKSPKGSKKSPKSPKGSKKSPKSPKSPKGSKKSPKSPKSPKGSRKSPQTHKSPKGSKKSPKSHKSPKGSKKSKSPKTAKANKKSPKSHKSLKASKKSLKSHKSPKASKKSPKSHKSLKASKLSKKSPKSRKHSKKSPAMHLEMSKMMGHGRSLRPSTKKSKGTHGSKGKKSHGKSRSKSKKSHGKSRSKSRKSHGKSKKSKKHG